MSDQPQSITIGEATFHLIYADLLPPLTEFEYTTLRGSIKQHGIRKPVHVRQRADGSLDVLDGQHRLLIAAELDLALDAIPLQHEDVDDDTAEILALSLNLARRHLSQEQRQQYAVMLREKGKSLRAIGATLGVNASTVKRDLDAAADDPAVAFATPDTVEGADGKQHPAEKPKTRVQQLADKLLTFFDDEHPTRHITTLRNALTDRETAILHMAINLLVADGQIKQVERGRYERIMPTEEPAIDDQQLHDLILQALGWRGRSLRYADLMTYIDSQLPDETDIEREQIQRVIEAMLAAGWIEQVPVNRLGRKYWWVNETEPDVDEFKQRIVTVLEKQVNGTCEQHRLATSCGQRMRFKDAHYAQALSDLFEEGVIKRANGSGPLRYQLASATGEDWTPGDDDLKQVRAAIRHALFHNPDREFFTISDITDRTSYTEDQVYTILLNLLAMGQVQKLTGGQWEPVTAHPDQPDFTVDQVKETLLTAFGGSDRPTTKSMILYYVRQQLKGFGKNIPFEDALSELELEGEVAPTGRTNPAGDPFYALVFPPDPDRTVAEMDGEPVTAAQIPGYDGLQAHAAELGAKFDKDKITLIGRTDNGAWHRAVEIGRKLVAAGIWNGTDQIEFDAYALHDKLFGVNPLTPAQLDPGNHYSFVHPSKNGRVVSGYSPAVIKILDALYSAEKPYFVYQVKNHAGISDEEAKNGIALLLEHGRVEVVEPEYPGQNKRYQLARATESPAAESTDPRDGDQPDRADQDGSDSATDADAQGDDGRDLEEQKHAILALLRQKAATHFNEINTLPIPTTLINRALRELVKARAIRKTPDNFYEVIEPDTELRVYLGELENAISRVMKELDALPMEKLTDVQQRALHERIARTRGDLDAVKGKLGGLDAWLTFDRSDQEPTEEPAHV